jgi:5-methylcytosine-specific restriction endonuclease McrA
MPRQHTTCSTCGVGFDYVSLKPRKYCSPACYGVACRKAVPVTKDRPGICSRCGVEPRVRLSYLCRACANAAKNAYRRATKTVPDARRLTDEERRAYKRQKDLAYKARNREKLRAAARAYYKRTYAADPARYKAQAEMRRARKAGAEGALTAAEWRAALARYGHVCAYCGAGGAMTKDHVIALSKGGSHTATNVVPACRSCNGRKSTADWSTRLRLPITEGGRPA